MARVTLKAGDVIEGVHGLFAKVVEVNESRYGLSAWVFKRDAAEKETVVDTYLNRLGVAQVMKGSEDAGESAPKAKAQSTKSKKEDAGE